MNASDSTLRYCKHCQVETARYSRGDCKACSARHIAKYRAANQDGVKVSSAERRAEDWRAAVADRASSPPDPRAVNKAKLAAFGAARAAKSEARRAAHIAARIKKSAA